jgi:hypothetical protein
MSKRDDELQEQGAFVIVVLLMLAACVFFGLTA